MNSRKIDSLIATKVMGWRSFGEHWAYGPTHEERVHKKSAWRPSKKIAHAWEILEHFKRDCKVWEVSYDVHELDTNWRVSNHSSECIPYRGWKYEDEFIDERADTAPMAICLAALRAVGIELK